MVVPINYELRYYLTPEKHVFVLYVDVIVATRGINLSGIFKWLELHRYLRAAPKL